LRFLRIVLRPFGYLAFVAAAAMLSSAARLLGERHALGFFAGRLASSIRQYPNVTRPGVQTAWAIWAVAFLAAVSPNVPLPSPWDVAITGGFGVVGVLHHFTAMSRSRRRRFHE
jgi:hypothetical protein